MKNIKRPNVAGSFYPQSSVELSEMLKGFLNDAKSISERPKAIIAPHAGYIYSGAIAASAYKQLVNLKTKIKTVVVFSPSHFWRFQGVAVTDVDYFETPLGDIKVNQQLINKLKQMNQVQVLPQAFEREHALEVHLPFLQETLGDFELVPLIVGPATPDEVEEVIQKLDGDDVFFVVSSDLSHFHHYDTAVGLDSNTTTKINEGNFQAIGHDDACGYYPLRGLLKWATDHHHKVKCIDQRNSGDTAGDKDSVVGYGAYIIY
jgi:AmmeMemoRadiSam system protein B